MKSTLQKLIAGIVLTALALFAGSVARAQTYSNAVMALNPAGYWPLQETVAVPNGYYIATNLGTLGAAANGYYQTWYQPSGTGFFATNNIVRSAGVTGDGDQALACSAAAGQYVIFPRSTNGVPNSAVSIAAPFSIEAWVKSGNTNLGVQPIVNEGRNPIAYDGAVGYTNTYLGFSLGQFKNNFYWQVYNARFNANGGYPEVDSPKIVPNTWYHVAAIFDGTNISMYLNGTSAGAAKAETANYQGLRYVIDPVSPLLIGTGTEISSLNGGVTFNGGIDEVAIYPGVLSTNQIAAHIAAAAGSSYASTVLGDSPAIYLRLDEPAMTTYPATNNYPVAVNYGSVGAAANGAYQPGTSPGAAGPGFVGFGAGSHAVAFNGFYGGVDVGGGALPAAFNPTGTNQPFTIATWFQGNPADVPGRFQVMVGHTDRSWRLTLDGGTLTSTAGNRFNPGGGPELSFASTADVVTNGFHFNDGAWHFVAGVFDGTNDYMYLDGVLAKSGTGGTNIVGTNLDFMIGGDPQYTFPSPNTANVFRWFDGQMAHVAFFTNALSATNIQQLFAAAGVPPYMTLQPQSATNNQGSVATIAAGGRGSAPLSYQWYKNNSPAAGQTNASLVYNPVATNNAGSYYLVVSNPYGAVTSSVATLTVFGPPTILQQSPTDVRVFAGMSPTLHVATAGAPPLYYQWTSNSTPISGATNSSYTVVNAQNNGNYGCTVSNFVGTAPINAIALTVLADPVAPYPVRVLGDGPIAYFRLDEASGTTAYDYAGGNNATYMNVTLGQPGYNSGAAVQSDPTETAAEFGDFSTNNNYAGNVPPYISFATPTNSNGAFSVEAWFNESQFQNGGNAIVAMGYGNGGEQFVLDTGNGASGALRFFVRNSAGAASGASSSFLPEGAGWHHAVGVCDEAAGHVYLYLDGALLATGNITVNSGILGATTPLSIGARESGNFNPITNDFQFFGRIDDVAIYNYALSATQVANHYYASGTVPLITQLQPAGGIVETNQGATVTFTVTAVGTALLFYTWLDNNNNPIPGATNASVSLTNVQQSQQQGFYTAVVSNLYGTATTNLFLNIDLGPPVIVADVQPANLTLFAGDPVTYSVSVSGSSPFFYQWYRNGSSVSGATNSSYTFAALAGTNVYYVAVTNAFSQSQNGGPTFSSSATVVGIQAPSLNPSNYTSQMKITFTGYNRGETLANFPALINLGTNIPGFSYQQFASPTGGDLRFAMGTNGAHVLSSEIDEWNPNGISSVWVQVPSITTTNDSIWAFWGNPSATQPPDSNTNGAVWLPPTFEAQPNYDLVWHLKESALPFADSTLQYPATSGVAPVQTNGIVQHGGFWNGLDYLSPGQVNLSNAFTLNAWFNIAANSDIQTIWANKVGGGSSDGFALFVNSYQTSDHQIHLETGNGSAGKEANSGAGTVSPGLWHMLSAVIDRNAGTARLYLDGTDVTASGGIRTDFNNTNVLSLGHFNDNNFGYHGIMDEARIRDGTNSANWIWASWMTVASNSVFQSYGSLSSLSVTLQAALSGGNLVLTWSQGTLQSSSNVEGPYSNVSGANSPYSVPASAPAQFYRVKVR